MFHKRGPAAVGVIRGSVALLALWLLQDGTHNWLPIFSGFGGGLQAQKERVQLFVLWKGAIMFLSPLPSREYFTFRRVASPPQG